MRDEVIEVSKDKRLILRHYETDNLLAIIVQVRHPFIGEGGWVTREHITLNREKAKKLMRILTKFLGES